MHLRPHCGRKSCCEAGSMTPPMAAARVCKGALVQVVGSVRAQGSDKTREFPNTTPIPTIEKIAIGTTTRTHPALTTIEVMLWMQEAWGALLAECCGCMFAGVHAHGAPVLLAVRVLAHVDRRALLIIEPAAVLTAPLVMSRERWQWTQLASGTYRCVPPWLATWLSAPTSRVIACMATIDVCTRLCILS